LTLGITVDNETPDFWEHITLLSSRRIERLRSGIHP
jgi:hypothetical protein